MSDYMLNGMQLRVFTMQYREVGRFCVVSVLHVTTNALPKKSSLAIGKEKKYLLDKKGVELLAVVLSDLFVVGWINGLWHYMLLRRSM